METLLMLDCRNVAIGHEHGIAGMIMGGVELLELCVTKIWNMLWLAAAIVVIGSGGVEILAQRLPQNRVRGTHGTLHLVEHDAFILECAVGIVRLAELEAVSLLGEVQLV